MFKYKTSVIISCILFVTTLFGADYPGTLKTHNGAPTLHINGKPVSSTALRWITNLESERLLLESSTPLEKFNNADVKIVILGTDVGWTGEDKYNYDKIDKTIERFLEKCPDSYLVMSIYLRQKMHWFPAKYPAERFTYLEKGELKTLTGHVTASLFSEKFKTEATEAVTRYVRHMEQKGYAERIIGYQINWGNASEWLPWMDQPDLNPQALRAFRNYLKEKYENVENLRSAWTMTDIDFNNAMPDKKVYPWDNSDGYIVDPIKRRRLLDYVDVAKNRTTHLLLYFTGLIKDLTKNKALVGAYTAPGYRWQRFEEIVASKNIDFGVSSCFYQNRGPDGVSLSQALSVETFRRHGKLYWHDIDMRTYLWENSSYGTCLNPYESIMVMRREFAYILTKGAGNTWFNLYPKNNVFDSVELMNCIARLQKISNSALNYDSSSTAEIAVVYDSATAFRTPLRGTVALNQAYAKIGAPCDFYPINQLELIPEDQYKLIVFASCSSFNDQQREKLKKLKNNKRTLLFMYANGIMKEDKFNVAAMGEITSFEHEILTGRDMYMNVEQNWQNQFPVQIPQLGQLTGPASTYRFPIIPQANDNIIARASDGRVIFALRKNKDWNSFYYAGYQMRTEILRAIAKVAGVHIFYPYNDATYAGNKHFAVVTGGTGGERQLSFPQNIYIYDIYSNEIIETIDRKLKLNFLPYETKIFFMGSKHQVELFKKSLNL